MGIVQPWHLIVVLIVALIVFGPGKLTGLGRDLGSSIRDFRKSLQDDVQPDVDPRSAETPKPPASETKSGDSGSA